MKGTEGSKILSSFTLIFGLWNLYGSSILLWGMITNPEYVASFDQMYINGGIAFYRFIAYTNPLVFFGLIIGVIGSFWGKKGFLYLIILCSLFLLISEILASVMDEEWLINAFLSPHISPLLYVFNIVFFSKKILGGGILEKA